MLLMVSVLVMPVTGATNTEIASNTSKIVVAVDNTELQRQYDILIRGFTNQKPGKDEWIAALKYLYKEKARDDMKDIYGTQMVNALDYFLDPIDGSVNVDDEAEIKSMYNQILREKNAKESVSQELNFKLKFENAVGFDVDSAEGFLAKIPEGEEKETLKEWYQAIEDEIIKPQKQPYYGLLQKSVNTLKNKNNIDTKNATILILTFLWAVICSVTIGIPTGFGSFAICLVEGFAIGLGFAYLCGDSFDYLADWADEVFPEEKSGIDLDHEQWVSVLAYVLSSIVAAVVFFLLVSNPIGQAIAGGILFMVGMLGIEYLVNKYGSKKIKSVDRPSPLMSFMKAILQCYMDINPAAFPMLRYLFGCYSC